jgi:ribosomal protein S12 methylthiotransferase accessory factor YcaO
MSNSGQLYSSRDVDEFLRTLASRGLAPKHVEVTKFGEIFVVNSYDELSPDIITGTMTTGIDSVSNVAVMKSVTERIERQTLRHAIEFEGHTSKHSSDGTAAYPVLAQPRDAHLSARTNALAEATERYCWATWWDDSSVFADISQLTFDHRELSKCRDIISEIDKATPILKLWRIAPRVSNTFLSVLIYFAELKNGGFISGGAAGPNGTDQEIALRGLSEMLRHSLAAERIEKQKRKPVTFYERRLAHFARDAGGSKVRERLSQSGTEPIQLPKLVHDAEIKHAHSDLVNVHRCLYEGQPPFVGGALERLCL